MTSPKTKNMGSFRGAKPPPEWVFRILASIDRLPRSLRPVCALLWAIGVMAMYALCLAKADD